MKTQTVTLTAGTAGVLAPGDTGRRTVYITTALTDVFLGGSDANATTKGLALGTVTTPVAYQVGTTDLYGFSATGGAVKVMDTIA